MIILFGTRGKVRTVGHLRMRCPLCGVTCAQALRDARRSFTLFFIPIVPISHTAALVCSSCGQGRKIDKATAEQMTQYLAGHALGTAGGGFEAPAPSQPSMDWNAPPAIPPGTPPSPSSDPGWAPPDPGREGPDPGMPMPDPPVAQPDPSSDPGLAPGGSPLA